MKNKNLSNPFSTGSGGGHFEAHVQASFVVLMLTGGYAPCLPCWPITKIKLQGKIDGFDTDDLIVFVEKQDTKEKCKLLGQIKHSINITQGDDVFTDVIQAAWNDFNNPNIFSKGKDIIVLITGPLSKTDSHNVQWLLSQARHTSDVDEFERKVEQTNFSPSMSSAKLKVIKEKLRLANDNIEISREDVYSFLNHFYLLGYDLGEEDGVVLSLLNSHISQFHRQDPQMIWSRIVDIVQTWNQNAGTITLTRFPEEIKKIFEQPAVTHIPAELILPHSEPIITDWSQHQYATTLAMINMIGAWQETNEADVTIVNKIINEEYSKWIKKGRELLQLTDSPISLHNGTWKIKERSNLWETLSSRVLDSDLNNLKEAVVTVLMERDPAFELSSHERYAAGIYGKVQKHSQVLREGLAISLALLGNRGESLVNCSLGKAGVTVISAIREIFENSDWILWGSLNRLLPILAEAAPDEFLKIVEHALQLEPCPFDELFSQEGRGLMGENYLTGLLWALEALAWDADYLVRVCIILGELAIHDPGGNWANRPANSLTTILLPWYPQTTASVEKRKVAVKTLCNELPDISWILLISLLPNQHQMSTDTYKPVWRNTIFENQDKEVNKFEYWDQINFYTELAIIMANKDVVKLSQLIDHLDDLPEHSFKQLLKILSSDDFLRLSEEERLPLWDGLTKLIKRHRAFSDADWALNENLIGSIESVAEKLVPSSPIFLYQCLFSDQDYDLYDENTSWEEQNKKIDEKRTKAIEEILDSGGLASVIHFSKSVKYAGYVGESLGKISNEAIDIILLPDYLNKDVSLIKGYVWGRYLVNSWIWADNLDKTGWSIDQVAQFLAYLPFTDEAWVRAKQWLKESEENYWLIVEPNIHNAKGDIDSVIDKMVRFGRPLAAINCLYTMHILKKTVRADQSVAALMAALSTSESSNQINTHHIVKLIQSLQGNPEISEDDLFQVEWAYLPLLDSHRGLTPKLLENRLANDPDFFCEVIRLVYRSKKYDVVTQELTDEKKAVATNAWKLLHNWRTPPGMQRDNSFDGSQFLNWIHRVKDICTESGHLEVAIHTVGAVLIYTPVDPDGLWINRTVANVINERDSEDMRAGFRNAIFNSRGVHWIDPTGKPEREIAEQYRQKAESLENAGYQRFAVILKTLSESYVHEAERIVAKHNLENI